MSCLRLLGVTACWRWPDLRRSSIRDSRSSRSCVRRGTRNRSRSFSRRTRNARSRCSPSTGSPPFAPRKPAPTRLQRASPGARRAPSPPSHPPNGRPICPGARLSMKRKRWCSLPPSESRWRSTRSRVLPAIRTQFPIRWRQRRFPRSSLTRPKPERYVLTSWTGPNSIARSARCSNASPRPAPCWYRRWNRVLPRRSSATATIRLSARSRSSAREVHLRKSTRITRCASLR